MTEHIDRDALRADVEYAARLTGTHQADSARDYYPTVRRIFAAIPALLDALDRCRESWLTLSSDTAREQERADRAEARIKAVEEAIETHGHPDDWGVQCVYVDQLRLALDGDSTN